NSYQRTSTEVRFCILSPPKPTFLQSLNSTQLNQLQPASSPLRGYN
ncbi:hypothetical protein, partial [Escherichia coli]